MSRRARTPVVVRSGVLVVVLLAVLLAGCGGAKKASTAATTTTRPSVSSVGSSTSSVPATAPASTSPASTTPTTRPNADVSIAVFPSPTGDVRFGDPVAAARAFATSFLHMAGPIVGAFAAGDARSGEVPVRATPRGPVTTVLVRKLGTEGSWWVIGSSTPNIRISQPAALATITSPVRLRGESTAFEATVNVSIREDGGATALAETYTMGGGNGTMGPFDTSVTFRRPAKPSGAIVMYTVSSETGNVSEATVIRVHFAGV